MTKSWKEDPDLYEDDCRPPKESTSIQYTPPWLRPSEPTDGEADEAPASDGNSPNKTPDA